MRARVADPAEGAALLVAELDGVAVGYLHCSVEADPFEAAPAELLIRDLIVVAAARRRGVAHALVAAAHGIAAARGIDRVTIASLIGNVEATAAYAALGFRPVALMLEAPTRSQA